MRIDTTRHLTYELQGIYKCASALAYLYEWSPTQDPKTQLILNMVISMIEKEYERANQHYIDFVNQAIKTRSLTNE